MTKLALWKLAQAAYKFLLRRVIVKAIDNPDKEIDDIILRALDALFNYKQNGS